MGVDTVLHLTHTAVWMVVVISAPPLIGAAAVGLVVGLFQTLTQIQDASLAFVFKIFVVTAILAATSAWLGAQLLDLNKTMLLEFPVVTR